MAGVKRCLLQVEVPEQLMDDLATAMKGAGIPVPDSEERWTMALDALKVRSSTLTNILCLCFDMVFQSSAVRLQWVVCRQECDLISVCLMQWNGSCCRYVRLLLSLTAQSVQVGSPWPPCRKGDLHV